jgi:metal-responsive CopG/Arc/MetJ family transcriptional regulator
MSKLVSVKIDEDVFHAVERCAQRAKVSRNAYINQAIRLMNRLQERKLLGAALARESRLVYGESREVLKEFEKFQDEGIE